MDRRLGHSSSQRIAPAELGTLDVSRASASCVQPCDFIDRYPPELQSDARALFNLLCEVTQCEAVMWGPSVVGFGQKTPAVRPESPDDGFEIGFSRRGSHLVLVLRRYADYYVDILQRLGGMPRGKNAIALPAFDEMDVGVLRELLERAWADSERARD